MSRPPLGSLTQYSQSSDDQRESKMLKRTGIWIVVLMAALPASAAEKKTGATGAFVDKNGNQVGPTINLPDCASCKVKQTGPNSYEVSRPKSWNAHPKNQ